MASSSVSDKTVKIHTLGGRNKQENRKKVMLLKQRKYLGYRRGYTNL
jgi:hypothetical protein